MSHSLLYAIAAMALCIASLTGFFGVSGVAAFAIVFAAVLIALVGVPHGGLDHWTGRRLLAERLGRAWPIVFLVGYLFVGTIVAVSWAVQPVPTIVLFFLASAWHFGREDGLKHWDALASGGLIIWVPAWMRPAEMEAILNCLIISESAASAEASAASVMMITRVLSAILIPVALGSVLLNRHRGHRLATVSTMVIAAAAPILWSFVWFFCGWHSIRGLNRMRNQEGLPWRAFTFAIAPMSVAAVLMVVGVAAWVGASMTEPTAQMRMMFIGLASIAVPHLFLHEIESVFSAGSDPSNSVEVAHVR